MDRKVKRSLARENHSDNFLLPNRRKKQQKPRVLFYLYNIVASSAKHMFGSSVLCFFFVRFVFALVQHVGHTTSLSFIMLTNIVRLPYLPSVNIINFKIFDLFVLDNLNNRCT